MEPIISHMFLFYVLQMKIKKLFKRPLLKIEARVRGSRFLSFSYKRNNKVIHLGLTEKNNTD